MAKGSIGFQVLPLTEGPKERVFAAVDKAIEVVRESGVSFQVGPFETVMEGDIDHLLSIVYRAQQAVKDAGFATVATYVRIMNSDCPATIEEKVGKYRAQGH